MTLQTSDFVFFSVGCSLEMCVKERIISDTITRQRRKLHALLVSVRCCIDGACNSMRGTADLLPVEDGSAGGSEALLRKQLSGLGVPMPWYASPSAGYVRARRFWLFIATTDCGPDQLKSRKNIAARIRQLPRIGFISMNVFAINHRLCAAAACLSLTQP